MTFSIFGFILIIGCLVARDEMLAAAQKKEFRRLRAAWEESHCPLPEIFVPRLPEAAAPAIDAPRRERQRTQPRTIAPSRNANRTKKAASVHGQCVHGHAAREEKRA